MDRPAMFISISARALTLAAAVSFAYPALAQVQKSEPDMEDIARTPLTDLNINPDDIPEVLLVAQNKPYASDGLATCNDIVGKIAELDQVLGPDYDLVEEDGTGLSRGDIAQGVVGSFIPFRGVIREVSGAAGDLRKLRAAVTAGLVRRGYLKGLGQSRGCSYPARPRDKLFTGLDE